MERRERWHLSGAVINQFGDVGRRQRGYSGQSKLCDLHDSCAVSVSMFLSYLSRELAAADYGCALLTAPACAGGNHF